MPEQTPTPGLEPIRDQLYNCYHPLIGTLYRQAISFLATIREDELSEAALLYLEPVEVLARETEQYLQLHQFILLPYGQELLSKQDGSHDCRLCSSPCTTRHQKILENLWEEHARLRTAVYEVQSTILPDSSPVPSCLAYHSLREITGQLCRLLIALLDLEEATFIPSIVAGQKAIHAYA